MHHSQHMNISTYPRISKDAKQFARYVAIIGQSQCYQLLARILLNRFALQKGVLSDSQFVFQKGRGTI